MAFKGESDDTRASLSYKLRKLLLVGRRPGGRDRSVRHATTGSSRSSASSTRATSWSWARRTGRIAALEVGGKDVVDVWGVLGDGIRL